MRSPWGVRTLAFLLLGSMLAHGQSDADGKTFVKTFVHDEKQIWTSPFRKTSYEGHAFPKYVLPFMLISGALLATDHITATSLPNTNDQTMWSRRVSQIGSGYTLAGIAGAMYFGGRWSGNKKARETGLLSAEALGHAGLMTLVLKSVTQRERPIDYIQKNQGGVAFFRGGDSFPSGHSSESFAVATVFAYEYGPDHRWVPYASYGLASVVAASRIGAEKHWLSDVFVGSTVGFLIGRYVFKTHHDSTVDSASWKTPQIGVTAHGATLAWYWQ